MGMMSNILYDSLLSVGYVGEFLSFGDDVKYKCSLVELSNDYIEVLNYGDRFIFNEILEVFKRISSKEFSNDDLKKANEFILKYPINKLIIEILPEMEELNKIIESYSYQELADYLSFDGENKIFKILMKNRLSFLKALKMKERFVLTEEEKRKMRADTDLILKNSASQENRALIKKIGHLGR